MAYYDEFENKYYNPDDSGKKPGENDNWRSIQEGFYKIGSTDLETSGALTLGKGTENEETLTAADLKEMKLEDIPEFFYLSKFVSYGNQIPAGETSTYYIITNNELKARIPANAEGLYGIGFIPIAGKPTEPYYPTMPNYFKIRLTNVPEFDCIAIQNGALMSAFENAAVEGSILNSGSSSLNVAPFGFIVVAIRIA